MTNDKPAGKRGPKTNKEQVNFRASELTIRQLSELAKLWGTTQTETLTLAIDRVYRGEMQKITE